MTWKEKPGASLSRLVQRPSRAPHRLAPDLAEIFGIHISLVLLIPGGLFELALAFWLLIKGFQPETYAGQVSKSRKITSDTNSSHSRRECEAISDLQFDTFAFRKRCSYITKRACFEIPSESIRGKRG